MCTVSVGVTMGTCTEAAYSTFGISLPGHARAAYEASDMLHVVRGCCAYTLFPTANPPPILCLLSMHALMDPEAQPHRAQLLRMHAFIDLHSYLLGATALTCSLCCSMHAVIGFSQSPLKQKPIVLGYSCSHMSPVIAPWSTQSSCCSMQS